ncbi:hypothetical protein FRB94_005352 [Tulasnella sp. JGI-2019a]|nr:hypothetical protein FRB93_001950 [Tulasnella sp. JGI-2019a]KAG9000563.1 hypothetical protein FRB94_005352 [Tulasnella sp. JGI-2019a]KAG9033769.1 hypothetical protein FRB95_014257 [Tulasnella sp. JGI-2019a]
MSTSTLPHQTFSPLDVESSGARGVKDIAFGSIAGMVSKVFEHPFDLCKVRLQAQVLDDVHRFNGPVDCLTQTWKSEGVRGLYRGLPFPVVGAILENAALFLVYNQVQIGIKRVTGQPGDLTIPQKAFAAACGGTVASFILTPLELIKCKMQVQMMAAESRQIALSLSLPLSSAPIPIDRKSLQGPGSIFLQVLRNEGFRGLWLGQTGTFLREAGGATAWFGTKEWICKRLAAHRQGLSPSDPLVNVKDLAMWESAFAGACAGVSYNIVLFPADSVKSALQTEEEMRPKKPGPGVANAPKSTFVGTFKALYKARGLKGLYAGCGVTVARAIPSSAMIFVIYDTLDKHFG